MRTPHAAKQHAKAQMAAWGWSAKQWGCLSSLWGKESGWRAAAQNSTPVIQVRNGKRVKLYAGGIPQILGLNPAESVPTQVNRGFTYIKARYNTPCGAWAFWARHKWY